jgi:hypothetical protein
MRARGRGSVSREWLGLYRMGYVVLSMCGMYAGATVMLAIHERSWLPLTFTAMATWQCIDVIRTMQRIRRKYPA